MNLKLFKKKSIIVVGSGGMESGEMFPNNIRDSLVCLGFVEISLLGEIEGGFLKSLKVLYDHSLYIKVKSCFITSFKNYSNVGLMEWAFQSMKWVLTIH